MGEEIEWRPVLDGLLRRRAPVAPFTTPLDLLRFRPLSPLNRVSMGLAVLKLQRARRSRCPPTRAIRRGLDPARDGPQRLREGLGPAAAREVRLRAPTTSRWPGCTASSRCAASSRARRRSRSCSGYPRALLRAALRRAARRDRGGGRPRADRPPGRARPRAPGRFVVHPAAPGLVPPRPRPAHLRARRRARALRRGRRHRAQRCLRGDAGRPGSPPRSATPTSGACARIEYHTALCLLLEIDRQFSPFYWTNIADPELPFVGLVEHTNFIERERYDGRRFLYVANYLEPGDPLLDARPRRAARGLRRRACSKVNPGFDPAWISERWLFREPAAQPIVTVGYHERIPPLQTGVPGLRARQHDADLSGGPRDELLGAPGRGRRARAAPLPPTRRRPPTSRGPRPPTSTAAGRARAAAAAAGSQQPLEVAARRRWRGRRGPRAAPGCRRRRPACRRPAPRRCGRPKPSSSDGKTSARAPV